MRYVAALAALSAFYLAAAPLWAAVAAGVVPLWVATWPDERLEWFIGRGNRWNG